MKRKGKTPEYIEGTKNQKAIYMSVNERIYYDFKEWFMKNYPTLRYIIKEHIVRAFEEIPNNKKNYHEFKQCLGRQMTKHKENLAYAVYWNHETSYTQELRENKLSDIGISFNYCVEPEKNGTYKIVSKAVLFDREDQVILTGLRGRGEAYRKAHQLMFQES